MSESTIEIMAVYPSGHVISPLLSSAGLGFESHQVKLIPLHGELRKATRQIKR